MAVIEIYKCPVCKRQHPTKAEAEHCEVLHTECEPIIEEIKDASNMELLVRAYAKLIEKVCDVKVVCVKDAKIYEANWANQISHLDIQLILSDKPKNMSFKELSKMKVSFLVPSAPAPWLAQITFISPNNYGSPNFNKSVRSYLRDRNNLMIEKGNCDKRGSKAQTDEIDRCINDDADYLDLLKQQDALNRQIKATKDRITREVKSRMKLPADEIETKIKGLDLDWVDMIVIL